MKANDRYHVFLELLNQRGKLSFDEISEHFGVSNSTARRMCIEAEKNGEGIRIYGGGLQSLKALSAQTEYSFESKNTEHIAEKMEIGRYASGLVESNEIIYISGGTTTQQLLVSLSQRLQNGEIHNVTVMTNSLLNTDLTSERLPVILTGGQYRPSRRDLAGPVAEMTIQSARFSKCFIGVDGIELPAGLIASDNDTAKLDRLASLQSDTVFILADYSKFHSRSYIYHQPFLPNFVILTDAGISEVHAQTAADHGISCKIVNAREETPEAQ